MLALLLKAVSGVPSPKFHLKRGFAPPVLPAVKVLTAPEALGRDSGGCTTRF